jgi:hypothetical protein
MPIILGTDPGLNGALARLDTDLCTLEVFDMPTFETVRTVTKRHIDLPLFKNYCLKGKRPHQAWIEEVHSSPQMGVVSAFAFGEHFAGCKGVFVGTGIPYTSVTPQRWKGALGVPADKDKARARASELFPDCAHIWKLKTKDGRAEAAMIAFYGALTAGHLPTFPIRPVS